MKANQKERWEGSYYLNLIKKEGKKMKKGIVLERSFEEVSISLPEIKKEKNFKPEGRAKMNTIRNKRTRLSFERPSQYPLPKGLIIGF